jgi:gluconate 2-dehydrogenase gamma chain
MGMPGKSVDRRQFLKSIAASGTVATWPAVASSTLADSSPPTTYRVFTPSQATLMEAVVDQLIPPDDFPGGKEAGTVHYIDQKLAGPYGRFYIDRYEKGLRRIDAVSVEQAGKVFASLPADQQSLVLHGIAESTEDRDFFNLLLGDTFEGYYGDPGHGGNRDGASWKMIGFGG